MKHENKRRVLAGVIAASLVLQAAAMNMTVFAEDTTEAAANAAGTTATIKVTDDETKDALTVTNGTVIPEQLPQGKLVNIKGTLVSADSEITAVTVAVFDQAMKRVTGSAAQPKAKTYDLSRLDDFVTFDKLVPGKYIFQVIASNATHTNKVVQEIVFNVYAKDATEPTTEATTTTTEAATTTTEAAAATTTEAATTTTEAATTTTEAATTTTDATEPTTTATTEAGNDVLTVKDVTAVPDSIKQGTVLNVKGTVTSANSNITYLTCGIYNAEGKFVTGKTIAPKVKSYDLQRLDAYVAFDKLPVGTYTFAVIASNAANTNYALVNKSFKVEAEEQKTTTDTLTITGGTTIPDSIKKGDVLSIRGTVTSASSNMTALTAGVYDESGKFMTGKTIAPKAKTYDLKNLDKYITFNTLAEGTYVYAVIATNAANTNYALVNKKFTVGAATTPNTTTDTTNDKLTITGGTNVPDTIAVGKAVNVTGTVTSASSNMTALTVGVYDENGKFVTGKTINPKAKTYDLKKLDAYVYFNKLGEGTYTYAVIASNAANTNFTLVSKKFNVGKAADNGTTTNNTADKLTISGGTEVPSNLAVGKALNVTGTVTSASSNMTALTVGVYDSNGKFVTGKTINPAAKTYDLKKLDSYVEFNKLAAGSYVYAVIASNAANTNFALVNKSFTVGSGTTTNTDNNNSNSADKLTITGSTDIPASIAVGKCLNVRGTVTSASSNMTALTVGVYDSNGKFVTGKTINPNAKSYDLKKLDAYVAFNILPAGTYTYAVIASNAANTNFTLVSKKFDVGSGSSNTNTADGITISGGTTMSSTLAKGKAVIVKGTLTSASSNLTSVTVGVYDSNGKMVTGKTASPNAKTYDLRKLDAYVEFNKLAVGSYTYRVIATNAANNGYTVVNQSFTVK